MAIITKQEYDSINKRSTKLFGVGVLVFVMSLILGVAVVLVFGVDMLLQVLGVSIFFVGVLIFIILGIKSTDDTNKCTRCGEYTKAEHAESECLGALKAKLNTIK